MSSTKKPKDDKKTTKKTPKGKAPKGSAKGEATPPKKARKGAASEAHDEATTAETPTPAPAAPAPAPAPDAPLHAGRQATDSVLDDDPARWIDGKSLHEKGKYLLNVCPKAKENPAESCIALRGQVAAATDERSCFWVDFGCTICEAPIKVTRASFDAFMALLDGELKAAEKLEASVIVRWDGLVATIRREGESDERHVTLDRFESGPAAEHFFLDAPEFAVGSHATVTIERLRNAATWKGDGTAHIFVSPTARQVWLQYDVGGFTFARAILAFDGSNLGVRQPSLPMDASGKKAAPPAPEKPTAAPVVEATIEEPGFVGTVHQIGPGMAWCMVQIDYSAAWERLRASDLADLSPFVADDVRRVVTWGPYPRERARARLHYLVMRLAALNCDPRLVPCDAPDLMARALGTGEPTTAPAGMLGDGITDAEFEEVPRGALPAPVARPFPTPDTDVCASLDEATWASLSDDERAELERLAEWDAEHGAQTLDAVAAMQLAEAMARMGLHAAEVERLDEEDGAIAFWKVRRAPLPPFPAPHARLPTVVEVPEKFWDALTPEQIEALSIPLDKPVRWYVSAATFSTSSGTLSADEARAVGTLLASYDLHAESVEQTTRYGVDVVQWMVGRQGEKGAAL
jgi:hypothetical protein